MSKQVWYPRTNNNLPVYYYRILHIVLRVLPLSHLKQYACTIMVYLYYIAVENIFLVAWYNNIINNHEQLRLNQSRRRRIYWRGCFSIKILNYLVYVLNYYTFLPPLYYYLNNNNWNFNSNLVMCSNINNNINLSISEILGQYFDCVIYVKAWIIVEAYGKFILFSVSFILMKYCQIKSFESHLIYNMSYTPFNCFISII